MIALAICGRYRLPLFATATAPVLRTGRPQSLRISVGTADAPPVGAADTTVSNVSLLRGDTRANLSIVRVGADGRVRVRNSSGQLQLVADVAGYVVG